jgi:hypothetical protein
MFVFPIADSARSPLAPSVPGDRRRGEPAVCLITVGGLEVAGQIGECTTLADIRKPTDHWGAGQIFPGIGGEQVLARARIPKRLRQGSLLGGIVRDGIVTVDVYDRNRTCSMRSSRSSADSEMSPSGIQRR